MPAVAAPPPPRDTSRSRRARRCLRYFFGHLCSNLGLFSLVVGYVLLGALLFEYLEADYELKQRAKIQLYRDNCLKELWQITESLNVLYEKNWTHLVHEQLRNFETSVVAATKVQGYDGKDARQWSFSGALLYSVTVITTIGYGNLAPKTSNGKVVTMLYALIGVPLMLLCLSNLGSLLADTFQFAYSQACCCHPSSNPPPAKHPHHHYDNHLQHQQQASHQHRCSRHPPTPHTSPAHHDTTSSTTVVEINNKVDLQQQPPPPRNATILNNGGRPRFPHRSSPRGGMMRPMPSEVRNLLTECAEYSIAQDSSDKSSASFLKRLRDPESSDERGEDNEEDPDEDPDDDGDMELGAMGHHSTPSRVPLIWRPNTDSHISKRPPTPPPRRPPPDPPLFDPGGVHPHHCATPRHPSSVRVPISIVLLVLAGYICLGASIFAFWEEWDFLDGAYFCFITLSTIGFGDLVPGNSFSKAETEGGQLRIVACCAYLILGLVLIAMSFTLVQEEVLDKCRQIALTIGILKRRDPH